MNRPAKEFLMALLLVTPTSGWAEGSWLDAEVRAQEARWAAQQGRIAPLPPVGRAALPDPAPFQNPVSYTHLDVYKRQEVTDVHVQSLRPLVVNRHGRLSTLTARRLELSEVQGLAAAVLGAHVPPTLGKGEDADGDYSLFVDGYRHRFRVNATSIQIDDQIGIHLVFRIHPNVPPPLAELGIPCLLYTSRCV